MNIPLWTKQFCPYIQRNLQSMSSELTVTQLPSLALRSSDANCARLSEQLG